MKPQDRFDAASWTVIIPQKFKRENYSKGLGFCGGFGVGSSTASHKEGAAWWPNGEPARLAFGAWKELGVRDARGGDIVGIWSAGGGNKTGAVLWRLGAEGALAEIELHDAKYTKTYAMGTGGGAQVGFGYPKVKKGPPVKDRALLWRGAREAVELKAPAESEASAMATDGGCHVGQIDGRPVMWRGDREDPVALAPDKVGEASGVRDGEQVGCLWTGLHARAALWKGTAGSHVDLTPGGFESARVSDCALQFQVGFIKKRELTPSGASSMDTRAVLWNGSNEYFDLQELLASPWTASVANRIEVTGDRVRICGTAEHVVTTGPGLDASQALAGSTIVIWEATLRT
jgi:hypothetical protein